MKPVHSALAGVALALVAFGAGSFCTPRTAAEERVSDWIEVEAGAATMRLRFALDHHALIAHGELVNRRDTPIWWRQLGSAREGFLALIPPEDEHGDVLRTDFRLYLGCIWEDNDPVTPEQLAAWRLDPGESAPLYFELEEARSEFGRLDLDRVARVAHCASFTAARATPPERSLEFEERDLVLGWRQDGEPVAHFVRDDEHLLPHYDPFAERPAFRSSRVLPLDVGPIHGEVELQSVEEGTELHWRLQSRDSQAIRFGLVAEPEGEWQVEIDGQRDRPWQELARTGDAAPDARAGGLGDDNGPALWSPGRPRSGTLRLPGLHLDAARPWHARIPAVWPARAGTEPVPTVLHVYFDPRYGPDLAVVCPFLDERDRWTPFGARFIAASCSASFELAGHRIAIHEALSGRAGVELGMLVEGAAARWADPGAFADAAFDAPVPVWVQTPGSRPRRPATPHLVATPTPLAAADVDALRVRQRPALRTARPASFRNHPVYDPGDTSATTLRNRPWQYLVPVALPTDQRPEHDLDFPLAWLHVHNDPDHGLSATPWPPQD